MKSFLKLVCVIVGIALLSAILAPLLYKLLPMFKFERIFNRLIMIGTIIAALLFVRFRRDTWTKYGLRWRPDSLRMLVTAFAVSVAVLITLSVVRVTLTDSVWAPQAKPLSHFVFQFLKAFLACALIGVIEEFFFRGFVFLNFKDRFRWGLVGSLVFTNIFYSLVHFVGERKPFIGDNPNFMDSLKLIKAPFTAYAHIDQFWMAAVGLLLFGLMLNMLVLRSGSLYPAIGMHAGCVFFLKTDGLFVNVVNHGHPVFGSNEFYDGMLGWAFILLLGFSLSFIVKSSNAKGFKDDQSTG